MGHRKLLIANIASLKAAGADAPQCQVKRISDAAAPLPVAPAAFATGGGEAGSASG